MNFEEYKVLSEKTLSTQFHCETKEELMLHAVMGMLTEIEELLDNHMSDVVDDANKIEEIGDFFWYISIISREYDLSLPKEAQTSLNDFQIILEVTKKCLKMLDFLKKKLFYNKPINEDLFIQYTKEITSLFISYATIYDISIEKMFDVNISKLRARYGDKFSSERAINRNLEVERTILEGK